MTAAAPVRDRARWLAGLAIGVGVAIRIAVLAHQSPLWADESMVAVGLLHGGFREIFRPLEYLQVAPPLSLLATKLAVVAFGHAEWVLRLPAFVIGVATLGLAWSAARAVGGASLATAVTLLTALSPMALRYSAELKPYGFDLLAGFAIVAIVAHTEWMVQHPGRARWLVAACAALGVAGSTAAPILVGALLLGVVAVPQLRRALGRPTIVAVAVLSAAAYLALYLGLYAANAKAPPMASFWSESYLAIGTPGALGRLREAISAQSTLLPSMAPWPRVWRALLVLAAGMLLLPRRPGLRLALLAPLCGALAFSAIGRFPLAPRLMLFVLPCLLFSIGQLLVTIAMAGADGGRRAAVAAGAVVLVALPALRLLPLLLPLSLLVLGTGVVVLIAPRLPRTWRPALPGALALVLAGPGGVAWLRHPVIEDGRETIVRLDRTRVAVYVPAASAATWLYYSSDWQPPDRARVEWYLAASRTDGAAVPFRGAQDESRDRRAGAWIASSTREVLGSWPGVAYRPPRGFISGPRPGWAEAEAASLDTLVGDRLAIIDTHQLPGAMEEFVLALERRGWTIDSVRREQVAVATFLRRERMPGEPARSR